MGEAPECPTCGRAIQLHYHKVPGYEPTPLPCATCDMPATEFIRVATKTDSPRFEQAEYRGQAFISVSTGQAWRKWVRHG